MSDVLSFADIRYPIFCFCRYLISDILTDMILTDTDIRYLQKSRYIGFSNISVIRYAIPSLRPHIDWFLPHQGPISNLTNS